MNISRTIPTIAGIQRVNAVLVLITTAMLLAFDSQLAAVSCLVGGAIVVANLFLLAALARGMLAAFGNGGTQARFGLIAAPLKLVVMATFLVLLLETVKIDAGGFCLGVLTQLLAVFIETGRVSIRSGLRVHQEV